MTSSHAPSPIFFVHKMKNFQRYMITSAAMQRDHYHQVFKIENNQIHRLQYDPVIDLCQPQYDLTTPCALPRELIHIVIDQAILYCIQGMNFQKAFELICIDRPTIIRFYRRWFGPSEYMITFRPHFFRISKTFQLFQNVLDAVIQFPNEEHDHYIALDVEYQSGMYKPAKGYNPWNFNGNINLIQIPKPGIFTVEDFRAFVTGPYVTDVVWMNGRGDKGYVQSDFFRLPVLVFVMTDHQGNIIPEKMGLERNEAFKGFSALLKKAFGPTTGVFFAVQGHYIFDDQILVEM